MAVKSITYKNEIQIKSLHKILYVLAYLGAMQYQYEGVVSREKSPAYVLLNNLIAKRI